jgi:hypothetical protein
MRVQKYAVEGAFMVDLAGESVKLPKNTRTLINTKLQQLCKTYYSEIPLDDIFDILKRSYIEVIDEEGSPWSGFLTGRDGKTTFELAMLDTKSNKYLPIEDSVLWMSWYKTQSGNYEVNCYLS